MCKASLWKEVRRVGKSWQELRRGSGKSWDELRKRWDELSGGEKGWEELRRGGKRWEELRRAAKSWEQVGRGESRWDELRRGGKSWKELSWGGKRQTVKRIKKKEIVWERAAKSLEVMATVQKTEARWGQIHKAEFRRCEASLQLLEANLVFHSYGAGNFRHPPRAGNHRSIEHRFADLRKLPAGQPRGG